MAYIYSLPTSTSFTGKGLSGYSFGPLKQKHIEVYYIKVESGHDTYIISKKITRTYYVLSGTGYFTIAGKRYPVNAGILVEIPPKVEYSYSGKMILLAVSLPCWFNGNDISTRLNPDVFGEDSSCVPPENKSWWARAVRARIFGKSPINAYLRFNRWLWDKMPAHMRRLGPVCSYGRLLHKLVRTQERRGQQFHTFFLRNRPELELIRRLTERRGDESLSVSVLGCSIGAEAYSIAWSIRSARPDLRLKFHAMDISREAVDFAQQGKYSAAGSSLTNMAIFERMSASEMEELFDREDGIMSVKTWIREGIDWMVGDAGDPELLNLLGPQDLVIANNFLCHMEAPQAERCLRNIARLVGPDGYLFVSGIDLDVRTRVARDLGWTPVSELLEEIHEGDSSLRTGWPWNYSCLEPLNKRRKDWKTRYAQVFQLTSSTDCVLNPAKR